MAISVNVGATIVVAALVASPMFIPIEFTLSRRDDCSGTTGCGPSTLGELMPAGEQIGMVAPQPFPGFSVDASLLASEEPSAEANSSGTYRHSYDRKGTTGPATVPVPAPQNESLPPQTTFVAASWQGCSGINGVFEADAEAATRFAGPEFEVRGETERTASYRFFAMRCNRVVIGEEIFEGTSVFHLQVRVKPLNPDWVQDGAYHYRSLTLASPLEFADGLAATGAPAEAANHEAVAAFRALGRASEVWTFGSNSTVAELTRWETEGQFGPYPANSRLWYPNVGGYSFINVTGGSSIDGQALYAGVLRLSPAVFGPGPNGSDLCCVAWYGQAMVNRTETWRPESRMF